MEEQKSLFTFFMFVLPLILTIGIMSIVVIDQTKISILKTLCKVSEKLIYF